MPRVRKLQVNDKTVDINADGERSLVSVLRDDLGLTGAKYGCGEGQCGACTVLVGGQRVRSCVTRVSAADGKPVRTVEGVAAGEKLHPLQEAFLEAGALQCGYCTCGMIMAGVALLRKNPTPTTQEIIRAMEGNVCRCGTYSRIVLAILQAAREMKGGGK